MGAQQIAAVLGGAALVAVLLAPARTRVQHHVARLQYTMRSRTVSPGRLIATAAPVAVLALGSAYAGPLAGLTLAIVAAMGVWALVIRAKSAVNVAEADQLAQFTSGLANQATVAPTVVEAIREAAPLVPGRIGQAATTMTEELRIGSLPEAAHRFAATVARPLAAMTANVLIEAHSGGIKWAQLVDILDTEAGEAAETARHFHRHVGRMMFQITTTLAMAVGVVVLTGWAAEASKQWMASSSGQTTLLAAAAMLALLHAWVLGRAQQELK